MTKFKKYGLPCPKCDSHDAYAIDHEGGGYCFSCQEYVPPKEKDMEETTDSKIDYIYRPHRGLSKSTVEFYDIAIKTVDDIENCYGFVYPNQSVKTKSVDPDAPRKDKYKWIGPSQSAGCFGRDKFDPGSKPVLYITEGEHDAPSVYEALGCSVAAISVQSSSTALRDVTVDRDYINSFDKIVLALDGDDPGKEATRKIVCSGLFDFNKMFIVEFQEFKDANAYAQEGRMHDLAKVVKKYKKFTPDNIISSFSEIEEALKTGNDEVIGTYPSDKLNDMLYGFHRQQVVLVKGLEGIGKTEIFRWMEHHLLKTTSLKLGLVHMEEDKATTIKGIATYELDTPCSLPDVGISDIDILDGYKKAVKGDESRVFIYTMFGGDDPDDVLDSIRFLVSSGGVDVVFLDHITLLVTGVEEGDERRKLDYLSTKLKKMAKELNFCLVMISHVNDDGQTRGSRNITKIADTVIHLERFLLSDNEWEKNCLYLTLEKNRKTGRTGKAGVLHFNTDTTKLEEV